MSDLAYAKVQAQQKTSTGSAPQGSLLQRTCACGHHTIAGGECSTCRNERLMSGRSQRAPGLLSAVAQNDAPAQESIASSNTAFDRASRFSHDFSQIPIHSPAAGVIQTKLAINKSGGQYEQEADRISQHVMRMPEPQLQRACACGACPTCQTVQPGQEQEELQPKRVGLGDLGQTAVPPIVHEVLRSPGQPLAPEVRTFMEPRFGHDFSQVRVHTDPLAVRSAQAVAAHAYTVGSDVVFASGRYMPASRDGQRLLAHELAHVVQQDRARAADPLTIQDVSDPAERAADFAAERLSRGELVAPDFGSGSAVLQRQSATSHSTGGPPGVAAEKYSEPLEEAYRRVGQTYRADAIQGCRLYGIELCLMILTEGEARAAYELAKEGYSPREAASQKAGPQPSVQRLARNPDGAAAATLPVFAGGGAVITAGLQATGAFVLTALPALALAAVTVLFTLALAEEIRFSRFVRILEENGFITLLNPLGACIGACHAASTARTMPRTIPWPEPITLDISRRRLNPEEAEKAKRDIGEETKPKPEPKQEPEPEPEPEPRFPFPPIPRVPEKERRRRRQKCSPTGLSPTDAIPMVWHKPDIDRFYPATIEVQGHSYRRHNPTYLPHGEPIGVPRTYWPRIGKTFQLLPEPRGNKADEFRRTLEDYGFDWEGLQADHVQDLQWSGPDDPRNLWPLDMRQNPSAGTRQNNSQVVGVCTSLAGSYIMRSILDLKRAGGYYGRWFRIARVER